MTSSLTQSVSNASRASLAVRTASRAVKQPAVLGRTCDAGLVEHADERALGRRIDAPQRDGDHLGLARLDRRGERLEPRRSPPVPRISRDEKRAARDDERRRCSHAFSLPGSPDDLDARVGLQARGVPLRARHDLAVDRDRHARGGRARRRARPARRPGAHRRAARRGSPLTVITPPPPAREAVGPQRRPRRRAPASASATSSPVIDASSTPLRWCPVGEDERRSARCGR